MQFKLFFSLFLKLFKFFLSLQLTISKLKILWLVLDNSCWIWSLFIFNLTSFVTYHYFLTLIFLILISLGLSVINLFLINWCWMFRRQLYWLLSLSIIILRNLIAGLCFEALIRLYAFMLFQTHYLYLRILLYSTLIIHF